MYRPLTHISKMVLHSTIGGTFWHWARERLQPHNSPGEGRMAEWLRYWTVNHKIMGSSPPYTRSFVPKVLGQDLYPKCALS